MKSLFSLQRLTLVLLALSCNVEQVGNLECSEGELPSIPARRCIQVSTADTDELSAAFDSSRLLKATDGADAMVSFRRGVDSTKFESLMGELAPASYFSLGLVVLGETASTPPWSVNGHATVSADARSALESAVETAAELLGDVSGMGTQPESLGSGIRRAFQAERVLVRHAFVELNNVPATWEWWAANSDDVLTVKPLNGRVRHREPRQVVSGGGVQ